MAKAEEGKGGDNVETGENASGNPPDCEKVDAKSVVPPSTSTAQSAETKESSNVGGEAKDAGDEKMEELNTIGVGVIEKMEQCGTMFNPPKVDHGVASSDSDAERVGGGCENDLVLSLKSPRYRDLMFAQFNKMGKKTPGGREDIRFLQRVAKDLLDSVKNDIGKGLRISSGDGVELNDNEAVMKIRQDLGRRNDTAEQWLNVPPPKKSSASKDNTPDLGSDAGIMRKEKLPLKEEEGTSEDDRGAQPQTKQSPVGAGDEPADQKVITKVIEGYDKQSPGVPEDGESFVVTEGEKVGEHNSPEGGEDDKMETDGAGVAEGVGVDEEMGASVPGASAGVAKQGGEPQKDEGDVDEQKSPQAEVEGSNEGKDFPETSVDSKMTIMADDEVDGADKQTEEATLPATGVKKESESIVGAAQETTENEDNNDEKEPPGPTKEEHVNKDDSSVEKELASKKEDEPMVKSNGGGMGETSEQQPEATENPLHATEMTQNPNQGGEKECVDVKMEFPAGVMVEGEKPAKGADASKKGTLDSFVSTQNVTQVVAVAGLNGSSQGNTIKSPSQALKTRAIDDQMELSDGSDDGSFEMLVKRKSTKKRKRKKSSVPKSLSISIPSHSSKSEAQATDDDIIPSKSESVFDTSMDYRADVSEEEDPLLFYSNTHEGQDPEYVEFHSSRLKIRLETELAKLEKDKSKDLEKIEAYLSAKWEDRYDTIQRQINKVRIDMKMKQTRQKEQLAEKHQRQHEADERKIEEGEKWLLQKQQNELQQKTMINVPNMDLSNIAAQLQQRHTYQRAQFEQKKTEMKKRSEQDLNAQNAILEAHHKKRRAEAEAYIKVLIEKCRKDQLNIKAKLSRLHEERFREREREIRAECDFTPDDETHSQPSKKRRVNASKTDFVESSISHDAVVRQNRRKSVMKSASIVLAVEIHNECIVALRANNGSEGEKRSSNSICIPWGSKARKFLYQVMVGEIPTFFDRIGRGGVMGGLVKCMITDCRTSELTAAKERADAFCQVQSDKNKEQVGGIEAQYKNACAEMSKVHAEYSLVIDKEQKITAAHEDAVHQFERAKQTLDKFKSQAQHFFNQDGTPSPRVNPESRRKLLTAMHKYKSAYESTKSKEGMFRQNLELAKRALNNKNAQLQRAQQEVLRLEAELKKASQNLGANGCDEDDSLGNIVDCMFTMIAKVAENRRSQVHRNKSNSDHADLWEKSMGNLPEEKKRSYHQKMLRRRITTVLRPSHESVIADVKELARRSIDSSEATVKDEIISPELRAEQLVLLALHPEAPSHPLPPVPDANLPSWAEPGWQLMIEDPDFAKQDSSSSILPSDKVGQLSQQFLSSCCSSGRQAASLMKPSHLQLLTVPLSFTCQASAPAETNPARQNEPLTDDVIEADPLFPNDDEDMMLGYKFAVRPTKPKESSPAVSTGLKIEAVTALNPPAKKRPRGPAKKKADEVKPKPKVQRRKSQTAKKKVKSPPPPNPAQANDKVPPPPVLQQQAALAPAPNQSQNQQQNFQQQQQFQQQIPMPQLQQQRQAFMLGGQMPYQQFNPQMNNMNQLNMSQLKMNQLNMSQQMAQQLQQQQQQNQHGPNNPGANRQP